MPTCLLDGALLFSLLAGRSGGAQEDIARLLDAPGQRLLLSDVAFADAVADLAANGRLPKERLCEVLLSFLAIDSLSGNIELLMRAVRLFARTEIEFSAAYLAALGLESGRPICSYDRQLDGIPGVVRRQP